MKRKLSKILGVGLSIAMVTSLLLAAVPASAISDAELTLPYGHTEISLEDADYKFTFELAKQLSANSTPKSQGFVITFPSEYYLDETVNLAATATIVAGPGWIDDDGTGANYTAATIAGTQWAANNTEKTITVNFTAKTYIGEQAEVRIEIPNGIDNPATPGDYDIGIQVWDFILGTAHESEVFVTATLGEPTIDPLAGIVLGYNSAGILMEQSHTINDCILAAGPGGTVEIGPGSYDQTVLANQPGQTIIGTGEPGTVIIKDVDFLDGGAGTLTISAGVFVPNSKQGVTVDGITFAPNAIAPQPNLISITSGASYATITNCDITSGSASAIDIDNNGTSGVYHTISNCTITATSTKTNQTAIIADESVTVADSTITVGAKATAISTSSGGVYPDAGTTIKGDTTISGSSGKGIMVTNGVVTIDGITLQSLDTAVSVGGTATVTMKNSVVDTCGAAKANYGDAIEIGATTKVRMYNNTIQNSAALNYAMDIANGADIEAHFNNILNNEKAIKAGGAANCSHNWWGSADGPAPGVNSGGPSLDVKPYLGAGVEAAALAIDGKSLDASATVGMEVVVLSAGVEMPADIIGVAKYTENPEITAPMIKGTGSVLGYYDLYVAGATGTTIQVKFYGAPSGYTELYYAGGISGRWSPVDAEVNTASGFLYYNFTSTSDPTIIDLAGMPFALVEDKTTTAGPDIGSGVGSPIIGSYDISTEPMFTWGKVLGSIRYEIALSEDPTFTIIEWSYNVDQNFYKVDEPLRYDTTYYWRVRGVLGEPYQEGGQWLTPATPWTTGIFTTAAEPEPPSEPIVVQPTKPEVNVEIPPTKITIEPAEQAIPNYMLWIIVAVGAILIIALIVLIVRTRRVV
jgi:hypothetical protein